MREGEIITCPWHGMEFDITTGQAIAKPKARLRQYAVSVEDGKVVVAIGGERGQNEEKTGRA